MIDALIDGFDTDALCAFLRSKFSSFSESRRSVRLDAEFPWASAQQIGVVKSLAGPNGMNMPLLVVVASLPGGEPLRERSSRVRQFNFARKVIGQALATPSPGVAGLVTQGLFVFHDADGNFRLSLVYGKAEGTKLVWSTARRLSFYIEAGAGNKTFRDRARLDWSTFDKLKDAFSVEKLTKEFYAKLFDWYQWALSDEMGVTYPNNTDTDADEREINEHIIRLITRLMFVWFLKQKHLVPANLFDPPALKTVLKNFDPLKGDNYYRAILQNLFFATLNSEIPERAFAVDAGNITQNKEHFDIKTLYRYGAEFAVPQEKVLKLFEKIPFLNGGLFECLDRGTSYSDGFSRNAKRQAHLPNRLFFDEAKGLIPLLSQYHFTVEENSPGDEEVALDPELLGKVFENLLGAYNPETKVAARNATGSFYTPREIVNYMVDESLKAHVLSRLESGGKVKGAPEEVVRRLFTDGTRPADEALCRQIADALVTAKILDPACGSGAFPMGILLRMVELLRILRKIADDDHTAIYDLKLQLIENCIYGGDIQSIAVQISKLRFFISLVCEQKPTADPKKNYGIHTLPNLETKFVAADSLIGLPRSGEMLPMANVEKLKKDLWEVRHKHFLARTYQEKKDLRKEDKKLRTELAKSLKDGGGFDTASAKLMAEWDPYDQNTSASWSDPEWMFNVKDGFDIVIGNPPYFNLSTVPSDMVAYLKTNYSEIHTGYNDIVYYFLCLSLRLLSSSGLSAFITSNYYLGNDYAQKLRLLLSAHLTKLINFKDYQVFSEASVHTCISFLRQTARSSAVEFFVAAEDHLSNEAQLENIMQPILISRDELKETWLISSKPEQNIIDRLHSESTLLGQISDIAKGTETGNNRIFTFRVDEIQNNNIEHRVLRRCIKNSHIHKYAVTWQGRYLLYADGDFSKKEFPNAFAYLKQHQNALLQRRGPLTNEYEWWRLHRPSSKELFDAPEKIVVPYRAPSNRFAYDDEQFFNDGGDIRAIVLKDSDYSYKYVLGLLNSRLLDWFYGFIGKPKGNAREYFNKPLALIPIKRPDNKTLVNQIESLVDRILAAKKAAPDADTSAWEAEIDRLVYALYGLTEEEIAIVEGSVGGKSEIRNQKSEMAKQSAASSKKPAPRKLKPNLPPSLPGWD